MPRAQRKRERILQALVSEQPIELHGVDRSLAGTVID
jgi:hypothetical protein